MKVSAEIWIKCSRTNIEYRIKSSIFEFDTYFVLRLSNFLADYLFSLIKNEKTNNIDDIMECLDAIKYVKVNQSIEVLIDSFKYEVRFTNFKFDDLR